jgi:AAA ATPase domain
MGVGIESDSDRIRLRPADVGADFLDAASAPRLAPEQLRAIQGGLLPGYSPDFSLPLSEWLDAFRASTAQELQRPLIRELASARASGDWHRMELAARASLALDPLNDEGTLGLAESLALTGSKAAAIQLLDRYLEEIGPRSRDLCLPATILRRRIGERFPGTPYRPAAELPFLGRATEMHCLVERFRVVRLGESHCVVICGEAGIGKTRLGTEFARVASLDGARVVRVAAQPQYVHRPMGAFVDVVPLLLELPGALGCSPTSMQALTRLTTHVDTDAEKAPDARDADRIFYTITQAISDLVDAIGGESPVVIFIDDVHWLDAMSLRVLGNLVSERKHRRLLVMLTCREASPLRLTARHADRASTIALSRLAENIVVTLISGALEHERTDAEPSLRAWMANASGGNPLFVTALTKHYAATREQFSVPPTLHSVLESRIQILSPSARTLLIGCVALGKYCTLERLTAVVNPQSQAEILDAMVELELAWLVKCVHDRIEVVHRVVSDIAIQQATPVALRLARHCVAELLEAQALESGSAADLWECAEHWVGVRSYVRAVSALRRCARHSLDIGRPREAAEVLLRGTELPISRDARIGLAHDIVIAADAGCESSAVLRGTRLLRDAGRATTHDAIELAELRAMLQCYEQVESIEVRLIGCIESHSASRDHRLRAGTLLAQLADDQGKPQLARHAHEHLASAASMSVGSGEQELEFLLIYHAAVGDLDASASIAERLTEIAAAHDPATSARMHSNAGLAFWRAGWPDKAVQSLEIAYANAVTANLHRLRLMTTAHLASHYWDLGQQRTGREWLRLADRFAEEHPELATLPSYATARIAIAIADGRVEDAGRLHQEAAALVPFAVSGRASRWYRACALRIRQLSSAASPLSAAETENLWYNHELGQEAGDASDLEIVTAWHALQSQSRDAEGRQVLQTYLNRTRRSRCPLSSDLQNAFASAGLRVPALRDGQTCPNRHPNTRSG